MYLYPMKEVDSYISPRKARQDRLSDFLIQLSDSSGLLRNIPTRILTILAA